MVDAVIELIEVVLEAGGIPGPLSVEGQAGVNVSLGVSGLTLAFVP